MAELAEKPMTVAEFRHWDDGTDTRYELVDGRILAKAPPTGQHGTIVMNAGTLLNNRLRASLPCRSQAEAGWSSPSIAAGRPTSPLPGSRLDRTSSSPG